MTKRQVRERTKKGQTPTNQRLIVSKWVFKKKGNGGYCARLCGLGYMQVPGLDFTNNFSPVVYIYNEKFILLWSTCF